MNNTMFYQIASNKIIPITKQQGVNLYSNEKYCKLWVFFFNVFFKLDSRKNNLAMPFGASHPSFLWQ